MNSHSPGAKTSSIARSTNKRIEHKAIETMSELKKQTRIKQIENH
jgi:hypothetical protein